MSARLPRRGGPAAACACALALAIAFGWCAPAAAAVDVEVRLGRRSILAGESTTLDVIVRGASGGVGDPELGLPPGLEVLGSAQSRNFSWVNGKSSSELVYRYELGAERAGRYTLGPVQVRIGNQSYRGAAVELEVTSAPRQVGGSTRGAATLSTEISPAEPYVGEPVLMRVRLVLRAALAEAPEYVPPAATGFWSERASDPETYYAQQGGERVLVTETRTRLYPLAAGRTVIGEATAALVLDDGQSPFSLFGIGQKTQVVRSAPVEVRVRPLPGGAPAGFAGAVGDLEMTWTADRAETAADVPVVVRLDVRGRGNLPLMRTPRLEARGFEVFGGSLEDSLAAPASAGSGRRRFQWTVLPSRPGRLEVPPPDFHWFDLREGRYRSLALPAAVVRVGPAIGASGEGGNGDLFPAALARHPVDPGATPARPWGLALAGALLGAAVAAWRSSRDDPARRALTARCREWLRGVGLAEGPGFWDTAGEACRWLEGHGSPTGSLGREISAARFGGQSADESRIRRRLVELLSNAIERNAPARRGAAVAAVLAVAALALAFVLGPRPGDERDRQRARAADQRARTGDLEGAAAEWRKLWPAGHRAGIAARLAWVDLRAGNPGLAAAWILRGDEREPRDPGLAFVTERLREAGGLAGGWQGRIPVRAIEWGLAAALAAAAGAMAWPDRRRAAAGLAIAALLAAAPALEQAVRARATRAVVLRATPLQGADVELEPGQVVRVLEREGGETRVRIGSLEGRIASDALAPAEIVP